ncbi:MAG TPA: cardiolipin synthase [Lachnospiraceae bacterium]|nr:cardiolipin synthase [Lachnospiraceae bacterium]
MTTLSIIIYIVALAFMVNVVLASIVVFYERRNPASTWAWLFVLFFVPIFGFGIYFIFGRDSAKQKSFADKTKTDYDILWGYINSNEKLSREVEKQSFSYDGIALGEEYKYLKDFAMLNINSGSWLTYNNKLEHFIEGDKKFDALINDIRNARKFIHLEYYILRGDSLGRQIVDELTKKASEGVEVRILYDYMGNLFLSKDFYHNLIKMGGYAIPFISPKFIRINCRNHRKIVVIDGEIGYVGGFNIGDEYLGKVKRFGFWRDTHVRFEGEVVDQLQIRFLMDWNYASQRKIFINDYYFPPKKEVGYLPAQIVCSGPDTQWRNVKNSYFKMVNEAEKNVFIETPYFAPDDGVLGALKVAALSGIDVRIIIPGHPDHPFVYWASMSYLGELLEVGVKCYQYETGFIHSKALFIDGIAGTVGTANMDVRSFGLNFEVNAFIYEPETVKKLEADFYNDLKECTEITREWYNTRDKRFRFMEAISRLISPML